MFIIANQEFLEVGHDTRNRPTKEIGRKKCFLSCPHHTTATVILYLQKQADEKAVCGIGTSVPLSIGIVQLEQRVTAYGGILGIGKFLKFPNSKNSKNL
jgi:hypothetical protein